MAPSSLLLVLLALLVPAIFAQNVLNFATVSAVTCNYDFTNPANTTFQNFTITLPAWPSTPATSFVLHILGGNGYYSAYASLSPSLTNAWTITGDSQGTPFSGGLISGGELWVPYQPAGTVVYVTVDCSIYSFQTSLTIEPVIPIPVPPTNVAYFNSTSINDAVSAHSHWFAIPYTDTIHSYYFWSELCQVPSTSGVYFNTRVSFPGTNVTTTSTCPNWEGLYPVSVTANWAGYTYLSGAGPQIQWMVPQLISHPQVFYINIGAYSQYILYPSSFSVYLTSSQADIYYTSFNTFTGHAIRVQDNLFIASTTDTLYPTATNIMKLYYLNQDVDSTTPLKSSYFNSACYLEANAQSALWTGGLKNGTQDGQMLLSSVEMVKAPNFFKKNKFVSGLFAITYNNLIVVPNIQDFTEINVPTNYVMFGAVIGLAVYAGILTFGFVGYIIHTKRQHGYQSIGHGHHHK